MADLLIAGSVIGAWVGLKLVAWWVFGSPTPYGFSDSSVPAHQEEGKG